MSSSRAHLSAARISRGAFVDTAFSLDELLQRFRIALAFGRVAQRA
jgi:hypothetical protein